MATTKVCWIGGVFSPTWLEREGVPFDEAGQVEAVMQGLATYTLMPGLAGYAYPAPSSPGFSRFSGNFVEVSGSFCIETDDPELIARYNKLVRSNVNTGAYERAKLADERRRAAWSATLRRRP